MEIEVKMKTYKVPCDFAGAGCTQRFKTKAAMYIHHNSCRFNYNTSEEADEVEKLTAVYGWSSRRLFKVQWTDYPGEDSWVPEDLL